MKITFLGSSHGVPEANRRCQSIMIEAGGKIYFVDMGTQSIEQLITRGIPIENVKSIFITHMHGDHTNGLISFVDLCSWYFKNTNPEFYLPGDSEKTKNLIGAWLENNGCHIRDFKFSTVSEGAFYDDGEVKVTALRTKHAAFSYSYLIEADGKRVYISGDYCGEGPAVDFHSSVLEKPLDLAICECAHFNANEYLKVFKGKENLKKLCITHYSPFTLPSVLELKEKIEQPFVMATDGLELNI